MNLVELQRKLLAVARRNSPSDRVPFAFEKRIMARLAVVPVLDISALWARALLRAAGLCAAVTLVLGAWSLLTSSPPENDLYRHLETTLFATVDQDLPDDSSL